MNFYNFFLLLLFLFLFSCTKSEDLEDVNQNFLIENRSACPTEDDILFTTNWAAPFPNPFGPEDPCSNVEVVFAGFQNNSVDCFEANISVKRLAWNDFPDILPRT